MPETLFIADLHLDSGRPAVTRLFLDFLKDRARDADALYILGDLFEVWIGDDDDDPMAWQVASALRALATAGVPVFFQHGNRDLLIGEDFCRKSGATLLEEETVIDLYQKPTLLMHGDTLCTDDTAYQAFRAMVHDPAYQSDFLSRPLEQRRAIAANLREQSREATGRKAETIMDVNPGAVTSALRRHGVTRLIHGHTHRPAMHDLVIDGRPARRIVLGDWYTQGSLLSIGSAGARLETLV